MHTRGNINDLSTKLTFCLPGGQEELPPPFPQSHLSGWNLARSTRSTTVLPPHLPICKICKTILAKTCYWKCTAIGFPTHPRIHPSHSPFRWTEWRTLYPISSILFAQPQAHLIGNLWLLRLFPHQQNVLRISSMGGGWEGRTYLQLMFSRPHQLSSAAIEMRRMSLICIW